MPVPQRSRSSGPAPPRTLQLAPASKPVALPNGPSPGQNPGATWPGPKRKRTTQPLVYSGYFHLPQRIETPRTCTGAGYGVPKMGSDRGGCQLHPVWLHLRGLGRRGAPGRARRIAPPPQRAGPGALALGGPVRPEAGPSGTAGPPRSRHAPRVRHGSIGLCPNPGFCTWGTMVPPAPGGARRCRRPLPARGCAAGPQAERSWAAPGGGGGSWRMAGAASPPPRGKGSSP